MSIRAKAGALFSAGALAAILLGSCGIDSVSFLDPPEAVSGLAAFKANDNPGADYTGVDAVYRIYNSSEQALNDVSKLIQRQNQNTSIPGEAISTYLTSASGLRYRPLYRQSIQTFPTFPDSLIATDQVSLFVRQEGDGNLVILLGAIPTTPEDLKNSINSASIILARSLSSFQIKPEEGDADFFSEGEMDNDFFLQVIVYSFGVDSSLRILYSDGIALEPITLRY